MSSWQRLTINRRNAASSTGPRTETGKRRSRKNAQSHGLSGKIEFETIDDPAILAITKELLKIQSDLPLQVAQRLAAVHFAGQKIRGVRAFLIHEIETRSQRPEARCESPAASALRHLNFELPVTVAVALHRLLRRLDRAVALQQQSQRERLRKLYSVLSQLDRYERRVLHQRYKIFREIMIFE